MLRESKYFRISVTNKCNLNCFYCHNEGNTKDNKAILSKESIIYMCEIAKREGFKKFKLTGGEPTIREDIGDIIKGIIGLGIEDLSIITNGTLLTKKIQLLKQSGLKRLNISLNTLNGGRFKKISGVPARELSNILKGIDYSIEQGYSSIKINFVYVGEESDEDLEALLEFVRIRNLVLVVLPVISNNNEVITLDYLYKALKKIGIRSENDCSDEEGITKKAIILESDARVLLRVEELSEHKPYKFCNKCIDKNMCREGIFPLRMSAEGELIPCLASNKYRICIRDAIEARDDKKIIEAIRSIREWRC